MSLLGIVAIAAIVLALRGNLRVGYGKEGWTFCFPCDKPAATSAPAIASGPSLASTASINPSDKFEAASASSAVVPASAPSERSKLKLADKHLSPVLSWVLKVPIYTSLAEAKKLVPNLSLDIWAGSTPNIIYTKRFLPSTDFRSASHYLVTM
ncbi:hypothetical protein [Paraburkholderia sp. BL6665CI2N2]|uniref:hypothetical protein n=1 Tax=Paraburkholderia sp. BL6665CI2N2 TaxID=1938806 RepID=UPI001066B640|nr:hypothetical protein [Paraburkholderia sp. BL6665CI2N2]